MILLDTKEVSRRLRISARMVRLLVEGRELEAVKLGRRTLFREAEIDRFMRALPVARFGRARDAVVPDRADANPDT
jgi:excisionase family DNA binding protein